MIVGELEMRRHWPRVAFVFIFFLLADSQTLEGQMLSDDSSNIEAYDLPASGVHLVQQDDGHVVISNGIVSVTLTVPSGFVTNITYKGSDNLLETQNKEDNRVYWDVNWKKPEVRRSTIDKLLGTSFKVIKENEDQVEISFITKWDTNGDFVPLNIDKRYIMLRDSPGFYTYAIFERLRGWPAFLIEEGRIVFKLQENKFDYMAMSDARQRIMPKPKDRETGKVLDYPEAVLLTNPSNSEFTREVDDKYMYSCENKDNKVHGWVSNDDEPLGMWMITPSNEFRTGGPLKQDLTSHVGPTMLSMFISRHYAGEDLALKFQKEEYWKKVFGPVYVYFNSHVSAKTNPSVLWSDAKQRMLKEVASWPYSFPLSTDFLKSHQRGAAKGRLLVHDKFTDKKPVRGAAAYVGLASPGDAGSWQLENKRYQFWTQTDAKGNFLIKNVIPGNYSLLAWIPGTIGDYKHASDIIINPVAGSKVMLRNVIFVPPRTGAVTLWEIGVPDRTAAEFFIPDPSPSIKIHHYKDPVEKFREYGLWKRYTDLYPQKDLVYTVGKNDYRKDWFFAQVTRDGGGGMYQSSTWEIHFDLENVTKGENYTLQLALASANQAELQVRFNNKNGPPHFTTGFIGKDNAVARHGIHGLYHLYSIALKGSQLVDGRNVIFLTLARGSGPFAEVMYDYIRLERPA